MGSVKEKPETPPANAGLDQLTGLAAAADLSTAAIETPGTPEAAAPAGPDYATEAQGMTDMVAALITGYEPRTIPLWNDERKTQIAAALAPVMEKYSFTLGNMPPEFLLVVMAGPPLYQSMRIIADGMNPKAAPSATAAMATPAQTPVMEPGANAVATATHSPEMMNLK